MASRPAGGGISTLPAFKLIDLLTKLSENRNQQQCSNQSDHKQSRQECHHPDRGDQQSGEADQLLQQGRTATTGELLHAGCENNKALIIITGASGKPKQQQQGMDRQLKSHDAARCSR